MRILYFRKEDAHEVDKLVVGRWHAFTSKINMRIANAKDVKKNINCIIDIARNVKRKVFEDIK